jgi:hypothetical protein
MPASPEDGARYAETVAAYARDVELWLLEQVAATLRPGIDRDDWVEQVLARVRLWRARADAHVAGAQQGLVEAVEAALIGAQTEGIALAAVELGAIQQAQQTERVAVDGPGGPRRRVVPPSGRGVLLDADRLGTRLGGVLQQAPRLLEDTLGRAITAGAAEVTDGSNTRVQAAQHVLDRLGEQGVVGYRDVAGRNWSLTSYVEMAVRTEAGRVAIDGHTETLANAGHDLVVVSDSPRECPLCRPFEGQVLSLSGTVGAVIVPSAVDVDATVRVDVYDTLEGARTKGFQHPNCTHSVRLYVPGVTRTGGATSDPGGYEAKQRQRAMERRVREWKRREALALDDAAAARARAKVRDWQRALREHVDANDLKRLSRREQINVAT